MDAPSTAAESGRAESAVRAFWPFLPVALGLFVIQVDFFSLGLALPVIADDFDVTVTDLQWVLSAYMLALGSLMIPASRLADLLGRKSILITGTALFGLASLICGLSQGAGALVGARVFQGVGAAMMLPVAFSLVTNETSVAVRPRVLGYMLAIASIGTAIGPVLGGGLASTVGWQWVFFANVPVTIIAAIWGLLTLRNSRDPGGHRLSQLDWGGAAFIVVAVATLSLGIDAISGPGFDVSTIALLVVGCGSLAAFVLYERRATWPILGQDLLRRRPFWVLVGAGTFANMCFGVLIIVAVIQLQEVEGMSAAQAGLVFLIPAAATAACGPISGRLTGRVPAGLVMAVSIVVGGLGFILQAVTPFLVLDLFGLGVCGLAFGMGFSFMNVATQSVLPEDIAGQASGLSLTILVTLGGVAVVACAMALELAGGATDMGLAALRVLFSVGLLAVLVGLGVGWTQRHEQA